MHSRFAKIFVESKRKQGDKDPHRVDQVVKCLVTLVEMFFCLQFIFIKFVTTQTIDFRVWTCSSHR